MAIGAGFPEVLRAAQLGAEWAWRALYKDLAPAVLGYLRLRGVAEPEDLTGEVFVQVVRGLAGFSGDEKQFRSWVFVVAHHRILDERRTRSRRPAEPAGFEALESSGATGNVEDEAIDKLALAELRSVLDTLSGDQRDVLLLRIVGGLTLEETAAATGKRVGAVKALQRRGIAAIRRNGMVEMTPAGSLAAEVA
jgi:RNA polymerase sigma factor (sigma-70 family)